MPLVEAKAYQFLNKIEQLKNELWNEYEAQSIPMSDAKLMPSDRQWRLFYAMEWRAKRLLNDRFEKAHGFRLRLSDGISYWKAKAKAQAREGVNTKKLDVRMRGWARPVVKGD